MGEFKRGKATSVPAGILTGGVTGLAVSVAGAMLAGKLLDQEWIPMESIGYCAMVILLVSAWLAAETAWARVKHKRAMVALGAGGSLYLMLLAMTALFFGGQYSGMGVTALLVLAGSGSSLLIGLYRKGTGNRGKYGKRIGKIVQSDYR